MEKQTPNEELLFRWRLILGNEAEKEGLKINSLMNELSLEQLLNYTSEKNHQIGKKINQKIPNNREDEEQLTENLAQNKESKMKIERKSNKSIKMQKKEQETEIKNELPLYEKILSESEKQLDKSKKLINEIDKSLQFCYEGSNKKSLKQEGRKKRKEYKIKRRGGSEHSKLTVPVWLKHIKTLFPHDVCEILEVDLVKNRGIEELVNSPELLDKIEPSFEMAKIILQYKDIMSPEGKKTAKRLIHKVVEDIKDKIRTEVVTSITGSLQKNKYTPHKRYQNLDIKKTLRKNLKNWNPDLEKLIVDQMFFFAREKKRKPWHIITVIDESGSMMDSIIHSSIMASIFWEIPSIKSSLVIFDTQVVDLSSEVNDPVEVLMNVQLGGGTDIAKAMNYTKSLVIEPKRTIIVLITDFFEGGNKKVLLTTVKNILEGKTKIIGLASIGPDPNRFGFDRNMANEMRKLGVNVLSCTPQRLSELIGKIIET